MDVDFQDYKDVAMSFASEEWSCLKEEQKELYRDLTMENYQTLCSLGAACMKPEVISEQGRDPYMKDPFQCEEELTTACFIVRPEMLSKLPQVLNDDDDSDCVYVEIDSESDQERELYVSDESDPEESEEDNSSDCMFVEPETVSMVESEKEPQVSAPALYEDDESDDDCIFVDPEPEATNEQVITSNDVAQYEDEDSSDCIYVEPHPVPNTGDVKKPLVKCEDPDIRENISVVGSQTINHIDPVNNTHNSHWEQMAVTDPSENDCIYVEPDPVPNTGDVKEPLVKCEDPDIRENISVVGSQTISHIDPVNNTHNSHWEQMAATDPSENVHTQAISHIDPVNNTHNLPWLQMAVTDPSQNGWKIENVVTPVKRDSSNGPESNGNGIKVWFVQSVATNNQNSYKEGTVANSTYMPTPHTAPQREPIALVPAVQPNVFLKQNNEQAQALDVQFKCPLCPVSFNSVSDYFDHHKVHEPQSFVCPECGKRFTDKSELDEHYISHLEEKIQLCQECGKCFTSRSDLEMHLKFHKGDKQWPCPECGKCLYSKSGLDRHQLIHIRDKPVPCPQCGKCFIKQSNFEMHLRLHAGEEFYPCTDCEKLFNTKAACERHIRAHTMERPHGCPECGKRFLYNGCLIKHMRVHTGERPFVCLECGKCFAQSSSLNSHRRLHEDEKPYVCLECQKCFTKKFNYDMHLQIHAKQKLLAHIAQITSENTANLSSPPVLQTETREHDFSEISISDVSLLERPSQSTLADVSCNETPLIDVSFSDTPEVDVSFSESSDLDVSIDECSVIDVDNMTNFPSEEKQHICHECGKSFPYKACLLKHLRSHTGEKPFACAECGKCFAQTSTLNCHVRTHSGEKPFSCPQCGKGFTSQSHVARHQLIHNMGQSFLCNRCGKEFAQRSYLLKHQKRMTCSKTS